MTNARKLVLPGGSGFLGKILVPWFAQRGWEVLVLSRQPALPMDRVRVVPWGGRSLGEWVKELDGSVAVVNLAGR